jgi:hypothetical protein
MPRPTIDLEPYRDAALLLVASELPEFVAELLLVVMR